MARDKQSEFRTGAEPVTLGLDELMSDASPTWEAMPWHPGLARIGHSVPEASWAGSRSGATDAPPAPPLIGSHCRAQSLGSLSESGSDAGIVVRINKCCSRATLHPRRWLDSDQRSFFLLLCILPVRTASAPSRILLASSHASRGPVIATRSWSDTPAYRARSHIPTWIEYKKTNDPEKGENRTIAEHYMGVIGQFNIT